MTLTFPPKVSAIVSTYNAEAFIKGLLDDLLKQTIVKKLEIIVIDSGSTQNEGAIVKEFQAKHPNIKYLRTERETVYKAWNRGIEMATGEYITNANTDDRRRVDAYEVMSKELDKNPDIALVYSDIAITTLPNETFECNSANGVFQFSEHDRNLLLNGQCYLGPMPMWRKAIHEKVGFFDSDFVTSGDLEFWTRASEVFEFKKINQVLGLYQKREDSIEHRHTNEKHIENNIIMYKYDLNRVDICRNWSLQKVKNHLTLRHECFTLEQNGNFEEAIRLTNELLKETKLDPDLMYIKGTCYFRLKNFDAAIPLFEKALSINPNHSLSLNNLAVWYWANKDRKKAISYMKKCVEVDTLNINAKFNLADMYMMTNKNELSISLLREIIQEHPYHTDSLKLLIDYYRGKNEVLTTYYTDILKLSTIRM